MALRTQFEKIASAHLSSERYVQASVLLSDLLKAQRASTHSFFTCLSRQGNDASEKSVEELLAPFKNTPLTKGHPTTELLSVFCSYYPEYLQQLPNCELTLNYDWVEPRIDEQIKTWAKNPESFKNGMHMNPKDIAAAYSITTDDIKQQILQKLNTLSLEKKPLSVEAALQTLSAILPHITDEKVRSKIVEDHACDAIKILEVKNSNVFFPFLSNETKQKVIDETTFNGSHLNERKANGIRTYDAAHLLADLLPHVTEEKQQEKIIQFVRNAKHELWDWKTRIRSTGPYFRLYPYLKDEKEKANIIKAVCDLVNSNPPSSCELEYPIQAKRFLIDMLPHVVDQKTQHEVLDKLYKFSPDQKIDVNQLDVTALQIIFPYANDALKEQIADRALLLLKIQNPFTAAQIATFKREAEMKDTLPTLSKNHELETIRCSAVNTYIEFYRYIGNPLTPKQIARLELKTDMTNQAGYALQCKAYMNELAYEAERANDEARYIREAAYAALVEVCLRSNNPRKSQQIREILYETCRSQHSPLSEEALTKLTGCPRYSWVSNEQMSIKQLHEFSKAELVTKIRKSLQQSQIYGMPDIAIYFKEYQRRREQEYKRQAVPFLSRC